MQRLLFRRKKQKNHPIRKRTGEHDDGRFWKFELVDEKVFHALGIVDASLELVARVPVRDADDHGLLAAVEARRRTGRRVEARRGTWNRVRLGWESAWVGDGSDSLAEGAADGSGAGWQLQRRSAVGAVDEHVAVHGCRLVNWGEG